MIKKTIGYILLIFLLIGCSGKSIYMSEIKHRVQQAHLTLKSKDIGNGLTISYYDNNVKSDKTLVLLHGFTDNKETWLLFAQGLQNKYHLIIPDQIGYGASSKPMGIDYSLEAQSKRLHKFLATFSQQNLVLVGNSMGGGVALTYASEYPLKQLILVDAMSVKGKHKAHFASYNQSEKQKLIYEVKNENDMKNILHLTMENVPYAPSSVLQYMATVRQKNCALIKYQTSSIYDNNLNVRNELASNAQSINIPTLIIWGKQDKLIDVSSAYALHHIITNSQLKIYNGVGHLPMQEVPYILAKDVLKFLR